MIRVLWLMIVISAGFPIEATLLGQGVPSPESRAAIAAAVDDGVAGIVPGPMLQLAKTTYLEGYGVVVTVEVALEPPRNPFSGVRGPDEVRRSSEMRRARLREMAVELLGQYVSTFDGLSADEQLTIVIYLLNTNPADLPDLPSQLVMSARKQDGSDLRSAVISETAFADRVTIREY